MDQSELVGGTHEVVAADIALTSKVDLGESSISICAEGMGPLTGTGLVEIRSNGSIVSNAGNATIEMGTDISTRSNILIDGGTLGNVTLANGAPAGNAQTVELDTMLQSIKISNGNIPGAMQTVTLCGLTQSIEMSAGALPVSPTIQMSPMGIKLSCGPTNFIEITPAGVKISGLLVDVEGMGQTNIAGGLVSVQGQGITAVKGAMVLIN